MGRWKRNAKTYQPDSSSLNDKSINKLIYKGSDLGSVGKVMYSFMAGSEGVRGEDIFFEDKGYIMGNGGGKSDVIGQNETIDVTVEWNGQIEKLILEPTASTQYICRIGPKRDLSVWLNHLADSKKWC